MSYTEPEAMRGVWDTEIFRKLEKKQFKDLIVKSEEEVRRTRENIQKSELGGLRQDYDAKLTENEAKRLACKLACEEVLRQRKEKGADFMQANDF